MVGPNDIYSKLATAVGDTPGSLCSNFKYNGHIHAISHRNFLWLKDRKRSDGPEAALAARGGTNAAPAAMPPPTVH